MLYTTKLAFLSISVGFKDYLGERRELTDKLRLFHTYDILNTISLSNIYSLMVCAYVYIICLCELKKINNISEFLSSKNNHQLYTMKLVNNY